MFQQFTVADQCTDGKLQGNVPSANIALSLAFPADTGQQGLAKRQLRRGQQILIAQLREFSVEQCLQLEILRLHI